MTRCGAITLIAPPPSKLLRPAATHLELRSAPALKPPVSLLRPLRRETKTRRIEVRQVGKAANRSNTEPGAAAHPYFDANPLALAFRLR